jgi:hypothetical protein
MSKPATRSKRKAQKARHKAKMRKHVAKRERREAAKAATAQRQSPGSHIMQEPNEVNTAAAQEAASDNTEAITDPIDGEVIEEDALEAEETTTLNEGHVQAESLTETTTEVVAEPGTEGPAQQAEGAENNG